MSCIRTGLSGTFDRRGGSACRSPRRTCRGSHSSFGRAGYRTDRRVGCVNRAGTDRLDGVLVDQRLARIQNRLARRLGGVTNAFNGRFRRIKETFARVHHRTAGFLRGPGHCPGRVLNRQRFSVLSP